ncbi:MAG: hypothetical protein PHP18_03495 [Bacilli bacterium]|nr:hypothetical protein [Bacilli bacterium]
MKKAIRNKVYILSIAIIIFVVFLAFIINFVSVKASSSYELSSKWNGEDVATPLEEVEYTSKYINFSEVYLNGHIPLQSEIYVIETANDLYQLSMLSKGNNKALYLSLDYVLGNDINYNDAANRSLFFAPIGYDIPFTGTFDGQGFEISNLFFAQILSQSEYINLYNESLIYYSMFSKVGTEGVVKNLGLKNVWMYQPIEWGQMHYASYLIGLNDGLVEHVYVKDDRLDSGLNVDGNFNISGLMSINNGIFREAFVSINNVLTSAVTINTTSTPVLTNNFGTIDNIYYDSTIYTGSVLQSDPSTPLATSAFQDDGNFDNAWYFNDSYYTGTIQSLINLIYPTLRGIKVENNKYLIYKANELVFMTELFKASSYFRNQNYVIQNDIDFNSISKYAYKTPELDFSGTFESNEFNLNGETLYTRQANEGATNYYSIIGININNATLVNNNATYGFFGKVSGEIKNINFVNANLEINNISDYVLNSKINIGFVTGIIDGALINNVHVYGNILIHDSEIGYTNIGGLIGEGQGLISSSSFNGSIDGGRHIYNVRADLSNIGGIIGYSNNASIKNSVNEADIIGYSYSQSNLSLYNYFGGIIGSGSIDYLEKVVNRGNITSSDKSVALLTKSNSVSVYIGGIIGKQSGLVNGIFKVNNEGIVDLYVPNTMESRIAGYGVIEGSDNYDFYSLSNSGEIKITHPVFTDAEIQTIVTTGFVEGAGVIVTNGVNGNYYGLYNDANVSINMSLVNHYSAIILNNNCYNSSGKYDNISTYNVGLNKKSTIFQAYNLGNIDVFSTNIIYHNWIKYSGVSVGKNIDFEELRNEGYININATHSAPNPLLFGTGEAVDGLIGNSDPQKTMKINGVFEEVSQDRYAKNIYNGGRLSFYNSNTLYIFNLFMSGIGYKNANTNMYAEKGIDYKSVDFTPVEGSIHNAVNDGEIYVNARIKGQSRMAGIVLINEGMLTSVANTGDIYNSNAIQSNANTGVPWEFEVETGGITFLMGSMYAQIRDSVNYGNIVSYASSESSGNGWVNASGIATRNDKMENNTDAGELETYQYFAKIAFTINYGDVFSYNNRYSDNLSVAIETHNKASGILSLGLCSSINNMNYGNIYGKNLASGIYGFVFVDKFVKWGHVLDNEIFIANSINYGKIRRISSPDAFQYNGENLGVSATNNSTIIQSTRLQQYAFGALIGKVHTGRSTGWNYSSLTDNYSIRKVAFSYLINFDSYVDVVGNNPTTTGDYSNTVANQITMYMATTKPDDTSLKPFQNISSFTLDNGSNGIFNIAFPLRTVPETENFLTDKYIKDFIQFIPKSKVNESLLEKIDFTEIASTAGIYALSSSKGIRNGLFMPDNIDLNKLNPIVYNNGIPEANTTWQYDINSGQDSLYNKFFIGMKQLEKAIATTIFDLEMYMVSDPSIKLRNPVIDDDKGLITYYVPTNSDPALGVASGIYSSYDYVLVTEENGESLGATWIPDKDNPNTAGKWVGDYKQSGSNYVQSNYFASNGNYNIEMTTNRKAAINNYTYSVVYENVNYPSTYIYERTNGQNIYVLDYTYVTAGNGPYSRSGYWQSRYAFSYVGPTEDDTYMYAYIESPLFDESEGFRINYEDESSYELAYKASFKYDNLVYPNNIDATILQTYGPYDSNGDLYLNSTLIDSYAEHYGYFRVYSESYGQYSPPSSDPDYAITYRDYKVLIKRVQPQSITSISEVIVDGVNSSVNYTNIKDVSVTNTAFYKSGESPSLEFIYATNNVPNGTDLKYSIKLFDSLDNIVDSSLYSIEEGIVETIGEFDEDYATYGEGSVKIVLRFNDQLESGTYRLETSLASNDSYNVNITKRMSNEAEFREFKFNDVVYDSFGKSELINYIPYGIFYNSNDINTKFVNFNDVESTILPSYLDSYILSIKALLTNVDFSVYIYNAITLQHEYRIVYTIEAEDGTEKTFTHRLIEEEPNSSIIKSFKDGNELTMPINESSLLREETSFFRIEYDLANVYLYDNSFTIDSNYIGDDPNNANLNQAYFINYFNNGFEVDYDYSSAIGEYLFIPKFQQEKLIYGQVVNWEFNFETMSITKLASDVSNLTNITFVSDTVYAGLNIIIDNVIINEASYLSYLDAPASRKITALPSSGISYNEYEEEQSFYIIGQVYKSDLNYYSPSFYLPTGAIIRKIIDVSNADNPELQSVDLFDDFTFDISGEFKYVQYRVYAEDYIIDDPEYGTHYTDYFISVQDITNNIYFNIIVLVDDSVVSFDFEKVYITFNVYQAGLVKSSMSLFSYFDGTRVGINEQFRSSTSGNYMIGMDLSEEYDFEIEILTTNVNIQGKTVIIPSEIIPRRYDMILRIVNNNQELEWGQQEIIDYIPNI